MIRRLVLFICVREQNGEVELRFGLTPFFSEIVRFSREMGPELGGGCVFLIDTMLMLCYYNNERKEKNVCTVFYKPFCLKGLLLVDRLRRLLSGKGADFLIGSLLCW
jgi:hypothetical protein